MKCLCQHCSNEIEFDPADLGFEVTCPICTMPTMTYRINPVKLPRSQVAAPGLSNTKRRVIAYSFIVLALLAVLFYMVLPGHTAGERLNAAYAITAGSSQLVLLLSAAIILTVFWIIFPIFVYFQMRGLRLETKETNRLPERIAAKP